MIEVKMQFTDADALLAFFSVHRGMTEPLVSGGAPAPKSAKAEKPAVSSPIASPASAAPATTQETESKPAELPYPPIAARITEMIAVSNPNSATNRTALKAFFAELSTKYGTEVKNGQAVKAEDRPALVAVLDGLAMS